MVRRGGVGETRRPPSAEGEKRVRPPPTPAEETSAGLPAAKSGATSAKQQKLKWKVDTDQSVIVQNFTRRGWARTEADDWNVYWANAATVKGIFHPESGQRLGDAQLAAIRILPILIQVEERGEA